MIKGWTGATAIFLYGESQWISIQNMRDGYFANEIANRYPLQKPWTHPLQADKPGEFLIAMKVELEIH